MPISVRRSPAALISRADKSSDGLSSVPPMFTLAHTRLPPAPWREAENTSEKPGRALHRAVGPQAHLQPSVKLASFSDFQPAFHPHQIFALHQNVGDMPGGFLIAELGGRLVQGELAESGRTAEKGQPVQDGKPVSIPSCQSYQPGHMRHARPGRRAGPPRRSHCPGHASSSHSPGWKRRERCSPPYSPSRRRKGRPSPPLMST